MKKTTFLLLFTLIWGSAQALVSLQKSSENYKTVNGSSLEMRFISPSSTKGAKPMPAILFFFGGGWQTGKITAFASQADSVAQRGMVAVLVQYRTETSHQATPYDCLADALTAMRYVRANAKRFNIDPKRICAAGGSAGGHLAAACALTSGFDAPDDDLSVSAKPNALVLFNPVVDNSVNGYGYDRIKERWESFSPFHNIRKGAPPTLILLGTKDRWLPVSTAQEYKQKMEKVGSRCDLKLYENQKHGFFNRFIGGPAIYDDTVNEMLRFLESIGYIQSK